MKNFEIAAIMNLMPSRADEAKALVPSLEVAYIRSWNLVIATPLHFLASRTTASGHCSLFAIGIM